MKCCSSCGFAFLPYETQTYSMLFGAANQYLLCPSCARTEQEMVEVYGTNDIPDLLATYRESSNHRK